MCFMDFWAHVSDLTSRNLVDPVEEESKSEATSSHKGMMIDYFNENTFDILQSIF